MDSGFFAHRIVWDRKCETNNFVLFPGYNELPEAEKTEIMRECEICNDKKLAAKTASDASSDLFFAVFVKVGTMFGCTTEFPRGMDRIPTSGRVFKCSILPLGDDTCVWMLVDCPLY